jgi:hypothetical protein
MSERAHAQPSHAPTMPRPYSAQQIPRCPTARKARAHFSSRTGQLMTRTNNAQASPCPAQAMKSPGPTKLMPILTEPSRAQVNTTQNRSCTSQTVPCPVQNIPSAAHAQNSPYSVRHLMCSPAHAHHSPSSVHAQHSPSSVHSQPSPCSTHALPNPSQFPAQAQPS